MWVTPISCVSCVCQFGAPVTGVCVVSRVLWDRHQQRSVVWEITAGEPPQPGNTPHPTPCHRGRVHYTPRPRAGSPWGYKTFSKIRGKFAKIWNLCVAKLLWNLPMEACNQFLINYDCQSLVLGQKPGTDGGGREFWRWGRVVYCHWHDSLAGTPIKLECVLSDSHWWLCRWTHPFKW